MKKFFVLFFSFVLLTSSAFAEKLPAKFTFIDDASFPTNWFQYLDNYSIQIYNAFNSRKYRDTQHGVILSYTINKDGSVSNINTLSLNKKLEEYARSIILNTQPPPFPNMLENDKINIKLFLGHSRHKEREVNKTTLREQIIEIYIEK